MANPFTPEQISQILEEFFKVVGTRQYIGARYVPIFGRKNEESIEWDNSAPYEPLTIVLYQGNSYTSRQYVPVGIEITNQEFWALTGNYNAQVEQYRRDVQALDGRVSANATAIDAETTRATEAENKNAKAISAETTRATEAENKNAKAISAETTRATEAESKNATAIAAETTRATEAEKRNADAIAAILPFDAQPTSGSTKGITSGAVYSQMSNIRQLNYIDSTKIALIFGDSIARGYGTSNPGTTGWANLLANRLGITAYNFAVDGASFSANIKDEVLTAHNSASFDDQKVGYIFVSGGINDHGRSYQDISKGMTAFFNNIRQYYPTAQVIFLPLLCANKPLDSIDQGDQQYLHSNAGMNVLNVCHTSVWNNVAVISDGYTWLQGFNDAAKDQVHPNDQGAQIIANNVYSIIRFGYLPPKLIVGSVPWDSGISDKIVGANSYNFYCLNNSMYSINAKIQFSSVEGIKLADTLLTLPKFAWGRQNQEVIVECVSSADTFYLFMRNSDLKFWTKPTRINADYYFRVIGMTGI